MNLLPVLSLFRSENLHVRCSIDDKNENFVHIVWTNTPTPLGQDLLLPVHHFKAESNVFINFSKFLHLWDSETDPKYINMMGNMRTEAQVRSAIESIFELYLTDILPLVASKDYDGIKDFFYLKRGLIVGKSFGIL